MTDSSSHTLSSIPPTLRSPGAAVFWMAVLLTGLGAGVAAAILTHLLFAVQHACWPGPHLLDAAQQADATHHLLILLAAGAVTGAGQVLVGRLAAGNSIDITVAISNFAGRLPALRTLATAALSVVVVGMGASLGREGAPKQAGAVIANTLADRAALSDEQRRLLVACGAGAGMAAAYGVPLGGALFAVEVLRGVLALRLILPALLASACAAGVAWLLAMPNEPTYVIPSYSLSASVICWSVVAGPIIGVFSVGFVQVIAWADRNKPTGTARLLAPLGALGASRSALHPVSTNTRQRQGNRRARFHGTSRGPFAPRAGRGTALCDGAVPRERCAGRTFHAVPRDRSAARGRARERLVLDVAGRPTRTFRHHRSSRCPGRHHARTGVLDRPGDGAHRSRPLVHSADAARGGHRHGGGAHPRCAVDLRCAIQRPGNEGPAEGPRTLAAVRCSDARARRRG